VGIFTERNVVTTVASAPLDLNQAAEQELEKSLPIVTTPEAVKELGQRGLGNIYPLDT